jgi:photosynthetic reaction center cytochrome c subunit
MAAGTRIDLPSSGKVMNLSPALCISALFAASIVPVSAQVSGTSPAPAKQKLAEDEFKNIQVLKGVPADQLIPTMQFIGASLGVECDFCHVERAFEKDDKKPKQIARKMMQMMFAINKDNFDGQRQVTCYSCHRGSMKPVSTPIIAVDGAKPPGGVDMQVASADSSLPAADTIIQKYIRALGGADELEKISSRVQKGKVTGFGEQPAAIEIYTQKPGKRVSIVHMPSGDSVTAYNGTQGWTGTTGRPSRAMSLADMNAAAMDADLQFATNISRRFTDLKVAREETVAEHPAYVVVGTREGYPPVEMYFDEESGLLVRILRFTETVLGRNPTQIDYADYRQAEEIKTPFRWSISRPSGGFTIQVEQVQQNVPIDQQKFVKPPDPPPAPKQG